MLHIVPKLIASDLVKKKKNLTPYNAGITLYSMASVGFHDQELYEAIML